VTISKLIRHGHIYGSSSHRISTTLSNVLI